MSKLFYDMDGVLANFDGAVDRVLGTTGGGYKYEFIHGAEQFWRELDKHEDFFFSFEMMPGADVLWKTTAHLKPAVLTALPKTGADRVADQKRRWVKKYLGDDVKVITCCTHKKPDYASDYAILIDDRAVNRDLWCKRGGIFILHKDAPTTLVALKALGVI